MKSDPDTLLNQLVVSALTVFIVILTLLATLLLRQFWLQQQIAQISNDTQNTLADLEEITETVQQELIESRQGNNESQPVEDWEEVTEVLNDVDEQLESIGENLEDLNEAASALQSEPNPISSIDNTEEQATTSQDQLDQIFTLLAIIIGIASIIIAIFLGAAVRIHYKALYDERYDIQ